MIEGHSGSGDETHLVHLALDPGVGNMDPRLVQVAELAGRLLLEQPIGFVDLHLSDGDRVWAVVEHGRGDSVRSQRHSLEHQSLDRRSIAPQTARRIELDQHPDEDGQQQQRQ